MTMHSTLLNALLLTAFMIGSAGGQDFPSTIDRFAGETRIASQPPLPLHLELHQTGMVISGTIAIPMGEFQIDAKREDGSISGHFEGPGGRGSVTLTIVSGSMTGNFTLGEAHGTIVAQRTNVDAQTFFKPPAEKLVLTSVEWLEDLDRLVEILTQEHAAPFHKTSRGSFEGEVARIRKAIPDLKGTAVALEFHKLAALIGDGHTKVSLPLEQRRLPLEFFWFDDGLRVVGASLEHCDLLGARLVAVNGVGVHDVVERLRSFVPAGETEWFVREAVADLFGKPDVLVAAEVVDLPSVDMTLEVAGGYRKSVRLAASSSMVDWGILNGGAPQWRKHENQDFWTEALADGSIYVNWRSYNNLTQHAAALLEDLDAQHPRRLIIDLRDNSGGDYNAGRAFIEEIGRRPWLNTAGTLYVLIGRTTFSAAMTNAVDFKKMTNAVLVGEPAGAAPNNWQEVRQFHLPNSGLRVGVSTLYYNFLPGEALVRPDLEAAPEPGDWGAAQDAGIRLILSRN